MGVLDIFWIFFIISTLQPVIKQRYLEASRQRLIAKIERKRGSRVILLVHREETMSLLGFPILRYIDINDSEEVLRAIHMTDPEVPLDLILHTPGGLVLAALQIARAIDQHKGKVTVFVPHYAMSGWNADRAGGRRDRHERPCGARPGGPSARAVPRRLAPEGHHAPSRSRRSTTRRWSWPTRPRRRSSSFVGASSPLLTSKVGQERADELAHILTEGTWTTTIRSRSTWRNN